jgi:hypothetical protein
VKGSTQALQIQGMVLFFLELQSLAAISVRLQQLGSSSSNVLAAFLL